MNRIRQNKIKTITAIVTGYLKNYCFSGIQKIRREKRRGCHRSFCSVPYTTGNKRRTRNNGPEGKVQFKKDVLLSRYMVRYHTHT
jgi:hypothetical protein